jgi:hypothetical protein
MSGNKLAGGTISEVPHLAIAQIPKVATSKLMIFDRMKFFLSISTKQLAQTYRGFRVGTASSIIRADRAQRLNGA